MNKIGVVYNEGSGSALSRQDLEKLFVGNGLTPTFWPLVDSLDIKKEAEQNHISTVVAAGGDGTVSWVAAQLADSSFRLAMLPLGTLNHFAKDLQIPADTEQAMEIITAGKPQLIDVSEVNGQVFINNSSIGIYPKLVRQREASKLSKWPAAVLALAKVLTHHRRYRVELEIDSQTYHAKTPFIFIGNNSYELSDLGLNNRDNLTSGILSIYWAKTSGAGNLIKLFVKSIFGKAMEEETFEAQTADTATIKLRQKSIDVAYDGEVKRMSTPLRYKSKPKSLKVIVP